MTWLRWFAEGGAARLLLWAALGAPLALAGLVLGARVLARVDRALANSALARDLAARVEREVRS